MHPYKSTTRQKNSKIYEDPERYRIELLGEEYFWDGNREHVFFKDAFGQTREDQFRSRKRFLTEFSQIGLVPESPDLIFHLFGKGLGREEIRSKLFNRSPSSLS